MFRRVKKPRRPAIPPSTYALAALVLTNRAILASGYVGTDGTQGRVALAVGSVLVLVPIGVWITRRGKLETILAVGISVLVGICMASLVLVSAKRFLDAAQSTPVSAWTLKLVSEPTKREDAYRCRARACVRDGASGDVWLSLPERVPLGSSIRCVGRFNANSDDEWGSTSRMQGVWGRVRAVRMLEVEPPTGLSGTLFNMRERLLDEIGPEASEQRALLAGCVCGYKNGLASLGLDRRFSACGISHLAAVSGSHLSIVVMVVGFILKALNVRPRLRAVVLMVASALFVLYCGSPVSAVRSWLMMCAALAATVLGRRSHALSSVSVAGLVLVLLDPTASGQPGFVLSVLSVMGLCLFSPYVTYVIRMLVGSHTLPRLFPRRMSRAIDGAADVLLSSVAASLVALVATLPVVADTFGSVSVVGPIVNAMVVVPFSVLVGLGVLLGAFCEVVVVRDALLAACDAVGSIVIRVVDVGSSFPCSMLDVSGLGPVLAALVLAASVVLLIAWPRVSRVRIIVPTLVTACLFGCLFVQARYFAPARVCVLDVGQGDAILIQEGASTMLVDTGPDASVAQALTRNNVLHLDAVLITHLHADHYAGLESLASGLGCKKVYVGRGVRPHLPADLENTIAEVAGGSVVEVGLGDTISVGGFSLEVVWPQGDVDGKENEDSLELVLTYSNCSRTLRGLLTGDAESKETGRAIDSGTVGDIDFLKVGHHGSAVSITARQARALDPEVSVASAGEGNAYGHPNEECVHALEAAGSMFLCTKDVGDVEICPGESGPKVRMQAKQDTQLLT